MVDKLDRGASDIVVENDLHVRYRSISNKGGYEYAYEIMVQ